ncbi:MULTISPECIES: Uma2 family endonuclease [Trichocoleus]|uniref:Uma2 family endonuclease n=1 Tax=Trichocoleus desertorum GB2-A4 TaxID=2933944 RepID=A0ABV0JBK6_9CYAN|nr:Uma2 family endonuclease [Trichocoleus sp. FACHB-46]MBD1860956.1 Uma2 family endonuclease [Trichocoleus sp. FACHB-46]
MAVFTISLEPVIHITDEQFYELCQANPDVKLERSMAGELIVMAPTGGETGSYNSEINADFVIWNRQTRLGKVFDSSTCFKLPQGGDRSPDVAWVVLERWNALCPEQQRKFPPIAPDFVLELLSPTDSLEKTQAKMQEYMQSGVRLGWLIDRDNRRVEIYRLGQPGEVLVAPNQLSGEDVLPGFVLDLETVW